MAATTPYSSPHTHSVLVLMCAAHPTMPSPCLSSSSHIWQERKLQKKKNRCFVEGCNAKVSLVQQATNLCQCGEWMTAWADQFQFCLSRWLILLRPVFCCLFPFVPICVCRVDMFLVIPLFFAPLSRLWGYMPLGMFVWMYPWTNLACLAPAAMLPVFHPSYPIATP